MKNPTAHKAHHSILLAWLMGMVCLFSGCNGEWTETYEEDDDCSSCYVVDDPLHGEGFICSDDSQCYGYYLEGEGR